MIEACERPSKARRLVSISYTIAPNAKMSLRASTSWPSTCSGAMYWSVPAMVPSSVSGCSRVGVGRRGVHRATRPQLRQTEVQQLGAGLREDDVAGLQVAVDDAGGVRSRERLANLLARI